MFDRIKQLFNRGYRDIKAVYYKDELLNMKLSTSVRKNYNIAKSIFAGMFGNIKKHRFFGLLVLSKRS